MTADEQIHFFADDSDGKFATTVKLESKTLNHKQVGRNFYGSLQKNSCFEVRL